MLIDAVHPEETRVVVLSGSRLEDFDYESATKKQLKGNIYLAKITRVEPSLQAAFVEYGGNRHGFLPFSEIHPDYYQIPIADREALLAEEAAIKSETAEEELLGDFDEDREESEEAAEFDEAEPEAESDVTLEDAPDDGPDDDQDDGLNGEPGEADAETGSNGEVRDVSTRSGVDTVGGDEVEDAARRRARLLRKYKIQEVIKRRQVILVQVTKEERGNKGAALTTYLSLAGRYCVLMPNTAKGGGISRKISSQSDRRRLKRIIESLDFPDGVAVIVRTAGSERTKAEIKRDYEYLMRVWGEIRDTTLASTAPALIYEEADLIKRSIRDLYQSDMDEILVEGEEGYKAAKAFMKSLMPSHAKKVKSYKDPAIPLFYRHQVEGQIDAMHNASVQLKSGGYIVMNMTEALVAIDVNSGKATRERHIEETAYKTNMEAAEEIARQLRLRDLAGLIVIDFIDMEVSRHNRGVERKLKDAMRHDRARIQLGRISPFGLLELSRQRLRPSLFESSTTVCPHCNASGYVRTTESMGLHVLRALEEEGIRHGGGELVAAAPPDAALHILNQMRERLVDIERRYGFKVRVLGDESLISPNYRLERLSQGGRVEVVEAPGEAEAEKGERSRRGRSRRRRRKTEEPAVAAEAEAEATEEVAEVAAAEANGDLGEDKPKRRRRRGKRGGRRRSRQRRDEAPTSAEEAGRPEGDVEEAVPALAAAPEAERAADPTTDPAEDSAAGDAAVAEATAEAKPKRRRSRSPRRKKAAAGTPKEAEDAPEPLAEAAPEAEPEAKPARRRRSAAGVKSTPRRKKAARDGGENAGPPNGEDSAPPVIDTGTGEQPETSPRRGWWQRFS
jgi:ribonuclease E